MNRASLIGALGALAVLSVLWEIYAAGTSKSGLHGFESLALFASQPPGIQTSLVVVVGAIAELLIRIVVCIAVAYPLALLTSALIFLMPFGRTGGQFFFAPLRATPLLALVPLFNFWFGDAEWSLYLYISFAVFVFTVVGALSALARMPMSILDQAKIMKNSPIKTLFGVLIPAAHYNLAGTREALASLIWAFALAAEFLSSNSGLGSYVIQAYQNNNVGQLAALLAIYALLALCMITLLRATQVWFRWNQGGWET